GWCSTRWRRAARWRPPWTGAATRRRCARACRRVRGEAGGRGPGRTRAGASMLTIGVLLGVHGLQRAGENRRPTDAVAIEETALGAQLPLLRESRLVQRVRMA